METNTRNVFLFAVGLAAAAVTVAAAAPGGTITGPTPIDVAVAACDIDTSPYATVLDDGRTLDIDGDGRDGPGLAIEDTACVLAETGITGAVAARMDQTRALDGTLEGTWGDWSASWTFHPDAGLDVLITWGDA